MSTPVPGVTQNDPPLSAALRVRVRLGGDVGVASPQAAAAGGPVEGAGPPGDPLAAGPAGCCPQAATRADSPMTAAARDDRLRMALLPVTAGNRAVRSGAPARLRRPATRFRSGRRWLGIPNLPPRAGGTTIMGFRYAAATASAGGRRPAMVRGPAAGALTGSTQPGAHVIMRGKSMSFGTWARRWSAL